MKRIILKSYFCELTHFRNLVYPINIILSNDKRHRKRQRKRSN